MSDKKRGKRRVCNRWIGMKKPAVLVLSLILLIMAGVGGTLAFLIADTEPVTNVFFPADVACKVTEKFDGEVKTEINVQNTGNTEAYLRVNLISYRVNEEGNQIGGSSTVPNFTLGTGWFYQDGFYYYKEPIAAEDSPKNNLAESIELNGSYNDPDGGKQVIEVMAEAIQARGTLTDGTPAVTDAWGVQVDSDGYLVPDSGL